MSSFYDYLASGATFPEVGVCVFLVLTCGLFITVPWVLVRSFVFPASVFLPSDGLVPHLAYSQGSKPLLVSHETLGVSSFLGGMPRDTKSQNFKLLETQGTLWLLNSPVSNTIHCEACREAGCLVTSLYIGGLGWVKAQNPCWAPG